MILDNLIQIVLAAPAKSEAEILLEHLKEEENIFVKVGLNLPQFAAQCIVFILIALALKKWAFDPVVAVLAERKNRIREAMQNADRIKKELAETEDARRKIIKDANEKAQKMITDAEAAAETEAERKIQAGIEQAEAIIKKAREATELDRAKMKNELKAEIAELVVRTTAAVAGKVLTDDDQRRLTEATQAEIAASSN